MEEATLGAPATPEVCGSASKRASKSDDGVQDLMDSMAGEMGSAERRNKLMSAIDKKVEGKGEDDESF
jgi:hypothetical protein